MRYALAALAAFVATLFFYGLLLPGSLANAQYAVGDASFAQCIASMGTCSIAGASAIPTARRSPSACPLADAMFGGDGEVVPDEVRSIYAGILTLAFVLACILFHGIAPRLGAGRAWWHAVSGRVPRRACSRAACARGARPCSRLAARAYRHYMSSSALGVMPLEFFRGAGAWTY